MNVLISRQETSILKGTAIISILLQHIGQALGIGIVNPLGPIGVFLFLFVSGYGLSCSYLSSGRRNYFRRKAVKVYIPYAIEVMLCLLWAVYINEDISFGLAGRYLLLLSLPQGSYWYLILMFYCYAVFYLLTFFFDKGRILIPALLASSVLIIVLQDFQRGYIWQFFSFPMGVLAGRYQEKSIYLCSRLRKGAWTAILLIAGAVMVLLKKMPYVEQHELGVADTVLQTGITLALGVWIIANHRLFTRFRPIKAVCVFFGTISYELYLSHSAALDYIQNGRGASVWLAYTVMTAVSLAVLLAAKKNTGSFGKKRIQAQEERSD